MFISILLIHVDLCYNVYFLCPKCRSRHKTIMVITMRAHCYPLDTMYNSNFNVIYICVYWNRRESRVLILMSKFFSYIIFSAFVRKA